MKHVVVQHPLVKTSFATGAILGFIVGAILL